VGSWLFLALPRAREIRYVLIVPNLPAAPEAKMTESVCFYTVGVYIIGSFQIMTPDWSSVLRFEIIPEFPRGKENVNFFYAQ
jgi:hypothetical protein